MSKLPFVHITLLFYFFLSSEQVDQAMSDEMRGQDERTQLDRELLHSREFLASPKSQESELMKKIQKAEKEGEKQKVLGEEQSRADHSPKREFRAGFRSKHQAPGRGARDSWVEDFPNRGNLQR